MKYQKDIEEIAAIFRSITRRNTSIVFNDYVQLAAGEQRNAIATLTGEEKVDLSNLYNDYKDDMDKFCIINVLLTKIMTDAILEKKFVDFLGIIFHQLNANNKNSGQFFTPDSLSNLTAAVCSNDERIKEAIARKGYIRVAEPSCGSGGMILSLATRIAALGWNPQQVMVIEAQDIDKMCVDMCFLNLNMYGLQAAVKLGDTLAQEVKAEHKTLGCIKCLAR